MLKRVMPIVAAGLALWQCSAWLQRRSLARDLRTGRKANRAQLAAWEAEGGALKETGSQLGQEPTK